MALPGPTEMDFATFESSGRWNRQLQTICPITDGFGLRKSFN